MSDSIIEHLDNEDLLEFIQYIIGCDYISDLRTEDYNEKAKRLLEKLDHSKYSLSAIEDAIEYLSKSHSNLENKTNRR